MSNDTLKQLVALSNNLGRPENDYVILGEGNTSTRLDEQSFYVKASGTELRTITERGFVQVAFAGHRALHRPRRAPRPRNQGAHHPLH